MRDLGGKASGPLGAGHFNWFRVDLRDGSFLFGVCCLGRLLGAMSTSMPVWVLVCVLVRVSVCVNIECDVLGGSGCCSPTCYSAGVVAASTVCVLASHVGFLGGQGGSLLLGMSGSVCCSVLATDGLVVPVVRASPQTTCSACT